MRLGEGFAHAGVLPTADTFGIKQVSVVERDELGCLNPARLVR